MQRTGSKPRWWKAELYDFIESMQSDGWVWELSRRARLKDILKNKRVDAMNPRPRLIDSLVDAGADYLYMSWPKVLKSYYGRSGCNRLSSVRYVDHWHVPGIHIPTPGGKWSRPITIDLNLTDKRIIRDFSATLKQIRIQEEALEPKISKPRENGWKQCLMVWDLYQYEVPWKTIADLVGIPEPKGSAGPEWRLDRAYKQYLRMERYIDGGGWKRFARFY